MHIHFIGIGGIGVSALAQYYLTKGHQVSGSDLVSSEITDALKEKGAKIFIGRHQAKNLPKDATLVIYSPAIPGNNPELKKAKKIKIKCQSYPEALGDLTKKFFTIAVCGSHGKSTVAAMIGLILTKAGLNPTVILGTKLKEFGDSNFRMGGFPKFQIPNSKFQILVIEADEYKESFLNYWPKIIVLTNLEPDHLDYYKNFKNYISAFKKFVSHLSPHQSFWCGDLPKNGILIANKDDKNISKLKSQISKLKIKIQNYSLKEKESKKLIKILKIPGEFNVSNALAALMVARALKIPDKISFNTLSKYKGSWRRFEEMPGLLKRTIVRIRHQEKKRISKLIRFKVVSDYGHHPTQIRLTLKAAREKFPKKKIWCIFQPHQYQRTFYLFNDFVKIFQEAPIDEIIITDIYSVAGRERKQIKEKVNSKKLVKAINKGNIIYIQKNNILKYLKKNLRGGEVVIVMGAGDIYSQFIKYFKI
jgi:UDP-N-acetylmuramate--alanine ligase